MESDKIPDILYCYHRIDDKGHTLDILRNKELYFANCNQFNDPFDCKIYPSQFDIDFIVERADEKFFSKDFTREDLHKLMEDNEDMPTLIKIAQDKALIGIGIKCLTPKPDNLLMWAHYADNHRGVCFEFDITQDHELFDNIFPIIYSDFIPSVNLSNREDIPKIYSTKSKHWEYEEEVRVMKGESRTYKYNPRALRSIICGCNMNKEKIDMINKIIKNDPELNHVILKKAIKSDNKFALEFITI